MNWVDESWLVSFIYFMGRSHNLIRPNGPNNVVWRIIRAQNQSLFVSHIFTNFPETKKEREKRSEMASNAAVPFWRAAGMTYITYSNICANLVRNCLKEPHKAEALTREKVHFSLSKWADGKPQKPGKFPRSFIGLCLDLWIWIFPCSCVIIDFGFF